MEGRPVKVDVGSVVVVEATPNISVGVCDSDGRVVEGFRCGVHRVEVLHGETDKFTLPFGVIRTRLGVGIPVGVGLDVEEGEGGFDPIAFGNARVADGLHPRLVICIAQPTEGDGVARGAGLLP